MANISASADHSRTTRIGRVVWTPGFESYTCDALYFIEDQAAGAIKIGRGVDPMKRLWTSQCGNPNGLTLLDALPNLGWQEVFWHVAWDLLHIRGEWFKRDPMLLDAIGAVRKGENWTDHVPPLVFAGEEDIDEEWREHMIDALDCFEGWALHGYTDTTEWKAAEAAIYDFYKPVSC